MYINTTNNVRILFENLLKQKEKTKLKILIYILNELYNNQINKNNEPNPDLLEDIEIFKFDLIGLNDEWIYGLLAYLVTIYKNAYIDNGNVIGIEYNKIESKLISSFEKLSYNEKLDVLSELFIRYDNHTYFKNITIVRISNEISGFDIAKLIQNIK